MKTNSFCFFHQNKVICRMWLVFDYVACSASVLCIVVISLDRYLLVSKGLSYLSNQKESNAVLIIIAVWGEFSYYLINVEICEFSLCFSKIMDELLMCIFTVKDSIYFNMTAQFLMEIYIV